MSLWAACLYAEDEFANLPELIVIGERLPVETPGTRVWGEDEISSGNALTLDALLAKDPAFSLYRRQSAFFGNPTSSGVSLRRTGATATSRTLILRDGIPQNDPFGGWVSWARYDSGTLASARLIPAAGAMVWGNQSPAGTVQLTTRTPERSGGYLQTTIGSHDTRAVSLGGDIVSEDGRHTILSNVHSLQSDGFYGLSESQRGAVDRRLDLDVRGIDLRSVWQGGQGVTLESMFSFFDEERGNGTVLSRNSSRAIDASLRASWETDGLTWQATGYYQRRDFAALFSSVNADRSFESPALDQFNVPGSGLGGGLTTTFDVSDQLEMTLGADVRQLRGETNENAGFVNGAFLRRRQAGGRQTFTGAFARAEFDDGSGFRVEASTRLDYWSHADGKRIERRPATGALLREDLYSDRDGLEPSFGITVLQDVGESITFSAAASSSFRAPTLNELYRPFRVRSDITEANPLLEAERFFSLGAGALWEPNKEFSLSGNFFVHWIDEAIANVPVTDLTQVAALGIFVPPGGSLQQRDNVDHARVLGFESKANWNPNDFVSLSLGYQWTETRFTDSSIQPLLENGSFPQSPAHQMNLSLMVRPREDLEMFVAMDYTSGAFDDALSVRPLDSYWNTQLGLEMEINDHLTIRAMVDNVFDEKIQTGLASNGLMSIGAPRTFWLSARIEW